MISDSTKEIKIEQTFKFSKIDLEHIGAIEKVTHKILHYTCELKGYLYGLIFTIFSCMYGIFVKLAPSYSSFNHAFIRYFVGLVIISCILYKKRINVWGQKSSRKLLITRGIVGSLTIIFGLMALKYLEVSDFETIIKSSILITGLMGRIYLKEKITTAHIFTFILTSIGVLFILRPTFLFQLEKDFESNFKPNITLADEVFGIGHLNSSTQINDSVVVFYLNERFIKTSTGVTLVLISACFQSAMQVATRKLNVDKVDFAVISLYPILIGLPISVIGSAFHYYYYSEKRPSFCTIEILYSVIGSIGSTIGFIFLNKALEHEDALRIAMLQTTGVFFSFILQYYILNVETDLLGVIGAVFIVTGTLGIMAVKIYPKNCKNNLFCKVLGSEF